MMYFRLMKIRPILCVINTASRYRTRTKHRFPQALAMALVLTNGSMSVDAQSLTLHWAENHLKIAGPSLPHGPIDIHYLEAYCRKDSQTTDWRDHTVIGHTTQRISAAADGSEIHLRCHVNDGLIVDHFITAANDAIDFRIEAHNPTSHRSEAHWAQPCVRVGEFTGLGKSTTDDQYAYLSKSFVLIDGQPKRMPFEPWAVEARYTPGQVWTAPGVPRSDVNPRPLSDLVPSHGLIGCFSADNRRILAIAFEPYQELFQGVIRCLHNDFRLGGIAAGQRRTVRGKIYIVPNDIPALLKRYERDLVRVPTESPK